jgi:hypothetical protein
MYDSMQEDLKDDAIQGKKFFVEDLSEDDSLSHLCPWKAHL